MSVFPKLYNVSTTLAGTTYETDTIDLAGFEVIKVFCVSNINYTVTINWSADNGTNLDLIESSGAIAGGTTYHQAFAVKSRFCYVLVSATAPGAILRFQLSFYKAASNALILANANVAGATLYDSANIKVKRLVS